jgi:rhodanese-related sulfurtransferase
MKRRASSIFGQFQMFEEEMRRLEDQILSLEQRLEQMSAVQRNHLIRVKNQEELSDDFIRLGKSYQDLTPEKAWELYQNPDYNFILIDVSSSEHNPNQSIPEAVHMPWENFREASLSLQSNTTPIFVISEDGTKSILACEFLVGRGFYNCNNVSGGHLYWKGNKIHKLEESA